MTRTRSHCPDDPQSPREPWWQWLVASIGAILLVGTAGYLAYLGSTRTDGPPAIALRVVRIQAIPQGYVVQVEAINRGGRTAAQVKVSGVLSRAGQRDSESELVFDYLPRDSPQSGGLFFEEDPRAAGTEIELRASGYIEP